MKIAAIIVTYNRKTLLKQVLDTVIREINSFGTIIIIDNNSNDGTNFFLKEQGFINNSIEDYENIGKITINTKNDLKTIYLKLNENLGGSGGYHYGVKLALEQEWDWLWFLDDDAMPKKGCLNTLLSYNNRYSVLIPLRESNKINYKEFPAIKFNLKNPFLVDIRDVEFYKKFKTINDFPETIKVEDFSFEGPLIKRDVISKIGLPKKDIFISGDDTDYALRIRYKLKEKLALITRAKIIRLKTDIKNEKTPYWKEYYLNRNYYYTHFKYGENIFVKIKPFALFLGLVLKNIVKLNFDSKKFKINYFAIIDSLKSPMPSRFKPEDEI